MRGVSRVFFAAMASAGILSSATPSRAVDVRIAAIPIVDYAGLWICAERDFCKDAGIDLKFQTLGGGAAIIAAMTGGSLDLGAVGIVPAMRAKQQGIDLVFVALASAESNKQEGGPQDIVLVRDPALKSGKDLEGKKVGVNELRGVGQTWVSTWVAKTGGDPSKVAYEEYPVPSLVAALAQGRVDAVQVSEPFRTQGLQQGMTVIAFSQQIRDSVAVAGLVTTRKFLNGNEDLMRRFVEAFAKSQAYAVANPGEVRKVLQKYTKLGDVANSISLATYPTIFQRDDIEFWKENLNRYAGGNITFGFDDIVWNGARTGAKP
jgi:NitT/TauT family transport system substrate-binding protein